MFIRKKDLEEIKDRLECLEGRTDRLIKTVGQDDPRYSDSRLLKIYNALGIFAKEEVKVTLVEKVDKIMSVLGLEVKHTEAKTEVVEKSVEPKVNRTKKASK